MSGEEERSEGMTRQAPADLAAEVRRFGVEPDFEQYAYDPNACDFCGQPVLIIKSRDMAGPARSERTACPYCMQRLSKRTKAREFRWVFLEGWQPA